MGLLVSLMYVWFGYLCYDEVVEYNGRDGVWHMGVGAEDCGCVTQGRSDNAKTERLYGFVESSLWESLGEQKL